MRTLSLFGLCISIFTPFYANTETTTMNTIQAVVLAAGKSSRFGKPYSKMLALIHEKPMIAHAIRPLCALKIPQIIIVGYQKEEVQKAVEDTGAQQVQFVEQKEQKGTGHAVLCAQPFWHKDTILITYGDMPLLHEELIEQLYAEHTQKNNDLTFLVAHNIDPQCAYGRIVPDADGILRIIEKKHFTHALEAYPLVNAGIYIIKRTVLEACLRELQENSVTHEIYLTDIVEIAARNQCTIGYSIVPFDAVRGINTQEEYDAVLALLAHK